MKTTNGKPVLSLREHNMMVIAEARSPLNLWGTGEELHRSPDPGRHRDRNMLMLHYINRGGIARLEQEHGIIRESWLWAWVRCCRGGFEKALPFFGAPLW